LQEILDFFWGKGKFFGCREVRYNLSSGAAQMVVGHFDLDAA
jgi:hypothetical protein